MSTVRIVKIDALHSVKIEAVGSKVQVSAQVAGLTVGTRTASSSVALALAYSLEFAAGEAVKNEGANV